jgi:hypothetical protein
MEQEHQGLLVCVADAVVYLGPVFFLDAGSRPAPFSSSTATPG